MPNKSHALKGAGSAKPPAKRAGAQRAAGRAASRPAAGGAGLGITAKSVGQEQRHDGHIARYAHKRMGANLLKSFDEKAAGRMSHCGYTHWAQEVELKHDAAQKSAAIHGVQSCGYVWFCPCCSPRISNKRRDELNALLSGAREKGYAVVMLTLTARHDRRTVLRPFLDAMKAAKQAMRNRRDWRQTIKPVFIGSVTATEVTHGANGFHPHFHEVIILDVSPEKALQIMEALRPAWLASLAGQGLSGNDAAYQVQPAQAAGEYVGKFGAAEELALHGAKSGRKGSRSPWQLLADADQGDKSAAAAWCEYAAAFKGRRQLVWSPGLKALFGIAETSDEVASEETADAPAAVTVRAWLGASMRWRDARRRRCALVAAAVNGADLDAAEYGITDAKRWDASRFGSLIE